MFPANGRHGRRFFGTERTLSADTIIRSVFARTARRVPGRVAHTRMLSLDIGFDYEIKNCENGARISRFMANRLRIAMISREHNGVLAGSTWYPDYLNHDNY